MLIVHLNDTAFGVHNQQRSLLVKERDDELHLWPLVVHSKVSSPTQALLNLVQMAH